MTESVEHKKLAVNTVTLYLRMAATAIIGFICTRILLQILGDENFGLCSLIAGICGITSFVSGNLSSSATRFLCADSGAKDVQQLRKTYSVTLEISLAAAVLLMLIAQLPGAYYLYRYLPVPDDMRETAVCFFRLTITAFAVNLPGISFYSLLMAKEDISGYAKISILDCCGKLAAALLISFSSQSAQKQIELYGLLLLLSSIVNMTVFGAYCFFKYPDCRFKPVWEPGKARQILSFSGWQFFGTLSCISWHSLTDIVLSGFLGTAIISSRSAALQLRNGISLLSSNFLIAVRPQILKKWHTDSEDKFNSLNYFSAKTSFFLLLVIALPVMLEMDFLLQLWLKDVPKYTAIIAVLTLCNSLIDSWIEPFKSAMESTGKISGVQTATSLILLLLCPLSYLILKCGGPVEAVFFTGVGLTLLAAIIRLVFMKKLCRLDLKKFFLQVWCKTMAGAIAGAVLPVTLHWLLPESFLRLVLVTASSTAGLVLFFFRIGLNRYERQKLLFAITAKTPAR